MRSYRFQPIGAILGALLLAAALVDPLLAQRSFPRVIPIGGADLGMVPGWSFKEWSDSLPGPTGPFESLYRWSTAGSGVFFTPVVPGQAQLATLRLIGARPDGGATPITVRAGGRPLASFAAAPALRRYHFFVPGDVVDSRSLLLGIDATTFRAPGEDRYVGVIGLEARLAAVGPRAWWPGHSLPLFVLSLTALLLANGLAATRTVGVAAAGLLLLLAAGIAAPLLALRAAATLAQLLGIAALAVGGARAWRRLRGAERLRHPWRRAAAALLLATALLFTPTMGSDGVQYYAYLRSLAVDGDLEFTNEYTGPDVLFPHVPRWLAGVRTPTGYASNLASVGPAIVWAPFYLLASLIVRAGNLLGANWAANGYALPYIALINLASVAALPLTIWFGYASTRAWVGQRIALLASTALALGSAIVYFTFFEGYFPHALAATVVAAYLWWWLRTRPARSIAQWAGLGGLAGAMSMFYWINAIFMLMPALELLPLLGGAARARDWRAAGWLIGCGALFLVAALAAFSPQMIVWSILYGSPFTVPHGSSFAEPRVFKAIEMLFSPLHGQLLWAPITFVALVGMGWYAARRRSEALIVLLAFMVYFLYNATLASWHGGGPFGLRRLVNALPLLAPGLAFLLAWLERRGRYLPLTLCAICLAWSSAVLLRYLLHLLPHPPSLLKELQLAEFALAPDNLPWRTLTPIVANSLFPTMLRRALRGAPDAPWVQLGLMLIATLIAIAGAVALIAWMQRKANEKEGHL